MPLLQLYAFGKLRLKCGDNTIETFPTRHVEQLLGYLLLHQESYHSREKLIDLLWAEGGAANGRASLSTTLWRLRKLLEQLGLQPDNFLQTSRDSVWFALEPGSYFDVAAFEGALAAADAAVQAAGPSAEYETLLDRGLAAYGGMFCEGIYEDWCLLARERLERHYLRASGQLMRLLMKRGAYEEAVKVGRRILEYDPLREEAHRAIMRCHHGLGQRAQGVRQFQVCSNLLQKEMGIRPMPETITLYQRMVLDGFIELEKTKPEEACEVEVQAAFEAFVQAGERLMGLVGGLHSIT
jgi:DNA-binding SARP family transcriptional activator